MLLVYSDAFNALLSGDDDIFHLGRESELLGVGFLGEYYLVVQFVLALHLYDGVVSVFIERKEVGIVGADTA